LNLKVATCHISYRFDEIKFNCIRINDAMYAAPICSNSRRSSCDMEEKRKIIVDCDTGSDDAIALILAMLDPEFELVGVTTVNGNHEVALCTDNSLKVVELCGKQDTVKVYRGCDLPLASTLMKFLPQAELMPIREGHNPYPVHPDRLPLPAPVSKEGDINAVSWLVETLLAADDGEITLVPVGPLTNIGAAMRIDSRIIPKIREIVLMGGGHQRGNESAAGEFNIWADPEAAEILLQSGCKVTIVPLDATETAISTHEDAERLRALGTPPAVFCADLIDVRIGKSRETEETGVTAINDALAVCAVLHPEVLKNVVHTNVHVDISRGFAYGYTIVDLRDPGWWKEEPNCYFALSADRQYFFDYMYRILKEDKERRKRA